MIKNGYSLTRKALLDMLLDHIERHLPLRRLVELCTLLILADISPDEVCLSELCENICANSHQDGGLVDCEDSIWMTFVLKCGGETYQQNHDRAIGWIKSEMTSNAWGYCKRDNPCIPITSLAMFLCPELRDNNTFNWLHSTWKVDLHSKYKLSYKASWYLLAAHGFNIDLDIKTEHHLIDDQRDSGGWGPWRTHPSPDDCFSTGIALYALSLFGTTKSDETLIKGIAWIDQMRLVTGLFPTHYIERGSAWVALGEYHARKRLRSKGIL